MAGAYSNIQTQPVTGTVHVDNFGAIVQVSGSVAVTSVKMVTNTTVQFTASTTPTKLISKNVNRKQLWVYMSGAANLYLGLGSVSTSTYFLKMESESLYELPMMPSIYIGEIWGVWDSGSGIANITEVQ